MKQIRNNETKKRTKSPAKVRGASRQKSQAPRQWTGLVTRVLRGSLLVGFLVIALVSAGWALVPMMGDVINQPIERVSVKGELKYLPNEQIQLALQPYMNERFFTVDLENIQSVLMALPWIENANVRRQWPGVLKVSVTEQEPVARWQEDYLLNSRGESFLSNSIERFSSFAQLAGPDGTELEVMDQYQILSKILRPLDLTIKELVLNHRGSWSLQTDKFEIMIGTNHVIDKIQRFVAVYNAALQNSERTISRIDVRYLNGVAVAWDSQPMNSEIAQQVLPNTLGRVKL